MKTKNKNNISRLHFPNYEFKFASVDINQPTIRPESAKRLKIQFRLMQLSFDYSADSVHRPDYQLS